MIIVGGEGELTEKELQSRGASRKAEEISVDIDESIDGVGNEECKSKDNLKPLNDVWAYDTLMKKWHEIKASYKIQGSLLGKKI
jgi:hypothetical protein